MSVVAEETQVARSLETRIKDLIAAIEDLDVADHTQAAIKLNELMPEIDRLKRAAATGRALHLHLANAHDERSYTELAGELGVSKTLIQQQIYEGQRIAEKTKRKR